MRAGFGVWLGARFLGDSDQFWLHLNAGDTA